MILENGGDGIGEVAGLGRWGPTLARSAQGRVTLPTLALHPPA